MSFETGDLTPALQIHLAYLGETLGDEIDLRKVDLGQIAEQHYPGLTAQILPHSERLAELVFRECHQEQAQELMGVAAFWRERYLPAAQDLIFIGACIGYALGEMPRDLEIADSINNFANVAAHFYAHEEAIMNAAFTIGRTDQLGFEGAYRRIQKCDQALKIPEKFSLTISMRFVAFGLLIASGRVNLA